MRLSILTATYNRGRFLYRLYESIKKNKNNDLEIEWIVVDDGSTDGTRNIIKEFIDEDYIEIKYIHQENKGKMSAINTAARVASGEIMMDCDSDDYFSNNAFEVIKNNVNKLFENPKLYAICFLKQDEIGNISGNKFKKNYMISSMFDIYFKSDIQGEKILVFNSKIRKMFEHELENNEKFITEGRMYHKMDNYYNILCINEVVQIGNYMDDGYTKNIIDTFRTSPYGYYKYFKEILQKKLKGVKISKKIYVIKHYLLFTCLIIFNKYFWDKKEPVPNGQGQKRTGTKWSRTKKNRYQITK